MQKRYTAEQRVALISQVEKYISQGMSERKACDKAKTPYSAYRYWKDRGYTAGQIIPQAGTAPHVPAVSSQTMSSPGSEGLRLISAVSLSGQGDMAALIGPRHVLERLLAIYNAANMGRGGDADGAGRAPS